MKLKLKTRWAVARYRWNGCRNMNRWTTAIYLLAFIMAIISALDGLRYAAIMALFVMIIAIGINYVIQGRFDKAHKEEITNIAKGA